MSIERTQLTDEQIEDVSGGRIWTKGEKMKYLKVTSTEMPGQVWWGDWNGGETGIMIDEIARADMAGCSDAEVIAYLKHEKIIRDTK